MGKVKTLCNYIKNSNDDFKIIIMFCGFIFLSAFIYLVVLFATQFRAFVFLTPFIEINCQFSDFKYINLIVSDWNPYVGSNLNGEYYPPSSYPPLPLLFAAIFSGLGDFTIIFILYYILPILICFICMYLMLKKTGLPLRQVICIFTAALISIPFIFAIERGNVIWISFLFLLLFCLNKDSNNKAIREISYLCLAAASAIKFYPFIFIILLLRKKGIYPCIRVCIYTLILLILPFAAFKGGFYNIQRFFGNFSDFVVEQGQGAELGFRLSITNLFRIITALSTGKYAIPLLVNDIGFFVSVLFLLFGIAASLFIRSTWKLTALLSGMIVLIPEISFTYVLIFMFFPLALFLGQKEKNCKDYIYLIFFTVIFLSLPIESLLYPPVGNGEGARYIIQINNFLQLISVLSLSVMAMAEGLKNLKDIIKKRRLKTELKLIFFPN